MKKHNTANIEKRIVILGSNSFIAKSLIKSLDKTNIKLLLVNRKICDFEKKSSINILSKLINSCDTIVFIAANAPVKNHKMFLSNLLICKNISLSLNDKKDIHLIYISSDAVYSDKKGLIDENSKTEPNSLHGLMHLTREKLLLNLKFTKFTILRPTLVYGLGDPHNGYGPNKFFRDLLNKKKISLFGKGEEKRDHIHIDDVGKIISKVIIKQKTGVLNLVTGRVVSFLEIAKKLLIINNQVIDINFLKRKGKMPHNGYRAFDNKKLKKFYAKNILNIDKGLKTMYAK